MARSRFTTYLPTKWREPYQKLKGKSRYRPYFDEKECIFIHIPKVAGQSVSQALFGVDGPGHYTIRDYLWENPEKCHRYFKFTFVRNPWDRTVSAYHYLINSSRYRSDQNFGLWLHEQYPDFRTFVLEGLGTEKVQQWVHFRPQAFHITDENGQLVMDHVGRFETLDQDLDIVARRLGMTVQIPRTNTSKHEPYTSYYDDRTIAAVADIYAEDIALLSYSFANQ